MEKGFILGLITPQNTKQKRTDSFRQVNTDKQLPPTTRKQVVFLSQKKKKNSIFHKSDASNFYTPSDQLFRNERPNQQSIVTYINPQSPFKRQPDFSKQKLNEVSVAISDFCGCQKHLNPCQIINQNFIKYAPMTQMKQSYQRIDMPMKHYPYSYKTNKNIYLSYLPSWYPQIYHTALSNILKNIFSQIESKKSEIQMGKDQFLCLAWIQYHSKIEYLTFFLFHDAKKQFKNYQNFLKMLDISLIEHATSIEKQNTKLSHLSFQQFLVSYYRSLGAILIPVSHYAQFLAILMSKGEKVLKNLLSYLLGERFQQFKGFLHSLNYEQFQHNRQSTAKCDWQSILAVIENKKD